MLTLYDFLPSGNGYKVRLVLRALQRPFRYREVDILKGESREPWFLAKSSVGQIPVLELDNGTCLSESTAIMFFLAEGTPLLPDDRVIPTRPEEFEGWWREGNEALDVLEARLADHPYLVEDRFTIADIGLYAYVHRADEGGFALERYPNLREWFRRIEARPHYLPIDAVPNDG